MVHAFSAESLAQAWPACLHALFPSSLRLGIPDQRCRRFPTDYNNPKNAGLAPTILALEQLQERHPKITWADLATLGAAVAVEAGGGELPLFAGGQVHAPACPTVLHHGLQRSSDLHGSLSCGDSIISGSCPFLSKPTSAWLLRNPLVPSCLQVHPSPGEHRACVWSRAAVVRSCPLPAQAVRPDLRPMLQRGQGSLRRRRQGPAALEERWDPDVVAGKEMGP